MPAVENEFVEVYSLSGVSVYKGERSGMPSLRKGVYIIRSRAGVEKICIK